MPTESVITPKLKALLGKEMVPTVWNVDRSNILQFAQAIEDQNPAWSDEKEARKGVHGGLIAPPTFLTSMRNDSLRETVMAAIAPPKGLLNGGNEIEWLQPIRPGDRITVTAKLADLQEKPGSGGTMLFAYMEFVYTNQYGEVAAKMRQTSIFRY